MTTEEFLDPFSRTKTNIALPDHFSIFCHLVAEEFLMKKGMQNTLQAFREEWKDRPTEVSRVKNY
jgi:hypothetical protein